MRPGLLTPHSIVLAKNTTTQSTCAFHNVDGRSDFYPTKAPLVCQATCALPNILPPVDIRDEATGITNCYTAVDMSTMHPVPELVDQIRQLFPKRKIGVIVSIGCGGPSFRQSADADPRLDPVLQAVRDIHHAVIKKAEIVRAEHDILAWTNYYRFDIGYFPAQGRIDEFGTGNQAEIKGMCESFCASKSVHIGHTAKIIVDKGSRKASHQLSFGLDTQWFLWAILNLELLTLKRLFRKDRELHPPGRQMYDVFSKVLISAAEETKKSTERIYGTVSTAHFKAAEIKDFLEKYPRVYCTPEDLKTILPTQLELTKALIPCHKSSLEEAAYVLDHHFDEVFFTRQRAEWIWNLAQKIDMEVRSDLWMEDVDLGSLQHSSDVLQLLKATLHSRLSEGPWSDSPVHLRPDENAPKWPSPPKAITTTPHMRPKYENILESVRKDYNLARRHFEGYSNSMIPGLSVEDACEAIENLNHQQRDFPPYQYLPLPDGNFTRTITLHPAPNATDDIYCDINFLDLERDAHEYDALSYTWGSPNLSATLICNGKRIGITSHLSFALRRFRSPSEPRVIWVDALSVNQSDIEEKTRQVQLMAYIYQQARSVLIYLGEPRKGQERYIKFIYELFELCGGDFSQTLDAAHNNARVKQSLNKVFGSEDPTVIEGMTRIPWFSRRWIVQEASMGNVAFFFFGGSMAPFEVVALAMTALVKSSYVTARVHEGAIDNLIVITSVRNYRDRFIDHPANFGILELLDNCHAAETSEPRDRLYALLSISPDVSYQPKVADLHQRNIIIRPDYLKCVGDIWTEFALEHFDKSSTLDILHCAGAFRRPLPSEEGLSYFLETGIMGLPSFIPDWAAVRRHAPFLGVSRFRAGCCTTTPIRNINGCQLQVSGIILDTIKVKTPRFPSILLTEDIPDVIECAYRLYKKYLSKGELTIEDWERMGRTLAADYALVGSQIMLKIGPRPYTEQAELVFEKHKDVLWAGFEQVVLEYGGASGVLNFRGVDDTSSAQFLKLQYAEALSRTMQGRSCFVSNRGYIGIAPGDCKVGDAIAIPHGARTPFILRSNPVIGHGVRRLIGDCYVYGFMNGEGFEVPGVVDELLLIS